MFNNDFRKITNFLYTFILFVLITSVTSAQSGKITGLITDAASGEPLFGANVILVGTSIGAATDFEGEFVIPIVPYGTHIVAVRYIGYEEKTVVVDLNASNQNQDLEVALTAEMIEGETVTITAQAQGQMGAINQQLTANTIANVVSKDKIEQLPDASAAAALSRLPGVSLQNGDQIVIRGVQAKNNLVMMNGVQLPSTDLNSRATGLGFISSNMLSGIEVKKVVTPDMDANVIGGTVNLRVREAPKDFHVDVLAQGAANTQDNTWDNYKFWASVSNRFFDNKFGVFIQGNANRSNGGSDNTNASYAQHQPAPHGEAPYKLSSYTLNDRENLNTTYGGSIILDYQLPEGGILFQNTLSMTDYDNVTHTINHGFNNQIDFKLDRNKGERKIYINALQLDYDFGIVKTDFTLSHSFSNQKTKFRSGGAWDSPMFNSPTNSAPYGYDANDVPIQYDDSYRQTMTADEAFKLKIDPEYINTSLIAGNASLTPTEFEQHIYNTQLDFTIPFNFSPDVSSEFKVGGKYSRTTRKNDINKSYSRTGSDNFYNTVANFFPGDTLSVDNKLRLDHVLNNDYDRGQYFMDGKYDFYPAFDYETLSDFLTQSSEGWASKYHKSDSEKDDFSGAEAFTAAYLMGTFNIGTKMTVILGGRYEHYNMKYDGRFFYSTHNVDGNGVLLDTLNSVDRDDYNFFPNVQIRYKFTDWMDLRLAYSQTISRPDYNSIVPRTYHQAAGMSSGNPNLKPTVSNNFDAYLSFYNNEIGLFTIGGFHKKMKDIFYSGSVYYQNIGLYNIPFPDSAFWADRDLAVPAASEGVSSYMNNPNPAYVSGIEFDWQTNFWYLPEPFNSLVFNINYTKVWSEMDYVQIKNTAEEIKDGRKVRYVYHTTDTIRTARLLNQADDVLNIALGVDYKGFSGRISFNMQGNVITSVGSRPEDDQFSGNIYKWDFSLKQELPIEGLSVSLNGVNIFHNPTKTYQRFRRVVGGEIGDHLRNYQYNPSVFELALRYKL